MMPRLMPVACRFLPCPWKQIQLALPKRLLIPPWHPTTTVAILSSLPNNDPLLLPFLSLLVRNLARWFRLNSPTQPYTRNHFRQHDLPQPVIHSNLSSFPLRKFNNDHHSHRTSSNNTTPYCIVVSSKLECSPSYNIHF